MKKLSVGQAKVLAEFCGNFAVAWLATGVIVPFYLHKSFLEFVGSAVWGGLFAVILLICALILAKRIKT